MLADTNSTLDYTEEDVLAVIAVSSVLHPHETGGLGDEGLHGAPPEIASEELDLTCLSLVSRASACA